MVSTASDRPCISVSILINGVLSCFVFVTCHPSQFQFQSIKAQGRWHDGHPVLTNYKFKIIVVAVDIHIYNLYSCL